MTVTLNPLASNLAEDDIFQAPKQSTLLCEDLTCEGLLPRISRDVILAKGTTKKMVFQWQIVRMAIESSHDQKHFTSSI